MSRRVIHRESINMWIERAKIELDENGQKIT